MEVGIDSARNGVPVAQLDSASASEAEGYRFESCRGRFLHPPEICVSASVNECAWAKEFEASGEAVSDQILRKGEQRTEWLGVPSPFAAMQQGKQPSWVALVNPFVGVIGVLLESKLRVGRGRAEPTA